MTPVSIKLCLLLLIWTVSVYADFDCACNFNVEKAVYPSPDVNGQPLGYLYEFDCKAITDVPGLSSKFYAVQFERKLGYVEIDNQVQRQICGGDPSPGDLIPPTTKAPPLVNGQWSDWQEWAQCTTSCGDGTRARTRSCDNPSPSNGGQPCSGNNAQTEQCGNGPCPIDGTWSEWQTWSQCSATCESGARKRNRTCDNPAPEFDGKDCVGASGQIRHCDDGPCPVDGLWSAWESWSKCSASCSDGTRTRTRPCGNPAPTNGGHDCVGTSSEHSACNEGPCPVDGMWSDWQTWSQCSVTCAEGRRTRDRVCTNPAPAHGGNQCTGESSEHGTCLPGECPVDGEWSAWTTWSPCSTTCGGGTHSRQRTCTYQSGFPKGNPCVGDSAQSETCHAETCPVDGHWSAWATWSTCTTTCGGGTHSRQRTCTYPTGSTHGQTCIGNSTDSGSCNTGPCPVDGLWSAWARWSACSTTCGGGTHTRQRTCTYPTDSPKGLACRGNSTDSESCSTDLCPVDGVWSKWATWSVCSATCGGGTHTRQRTCTYPAGVPKGMSCVGDSKESGSCSSDPCPVDGHLSAWATWSACTTTCGGGTHTRQRTCTFPAGSTHGQTCIGNTTDSGSCNTDHCPVDGNWGAWTTWSTCTTTCGGGTHTRQRTCTYQAGSPHGQPCSGNTTQSGSCQTQSCPVDGKWNTWAAWSHCTTTCGGGTHTRRRSCQFPPHMPQGDYCVGKSTESGSCHPEACPVDGHWSAWATWSTCTTTCGGGTHSRQRTCTYPTGSTHGQTCIGNSTDSGSCNTGPCPVDGNWGAWATWSTCTTTCGGGTHTRQRTCTYQAGSPHGQPCSGNTTQSGSCQTQSCPVDGKWTTWAAWSHCTTTCGGGTHTRRRSCQFPPHMPQGDYCVGKSTESGSCHPEACPVDGHWSAWATWSTCTTTCGGGTHSRQRTCTYPTGSTHGQTCIGNSTDSGSCNTGPCPVDGKWTTWAAWSHCTTTCGGGTHARRRSCQFPPHMPQGDYCVGKSAESGSCHPEACPVDGNWASWSLWGKCSVTCAKGTHSRTRTCTHPAPAHGGSNCTGSPTSSGSCDPGPCPVDGIWNKWATWSACTTTCGGGTHTRKRTCHFQAHVPNGDDCVGKAVDSGSCHPEACPVDGHWASWSLWGKCSVTCAKGTHTRTRTCTHPAPAHGGSNCIGLPTSSGSCDAGPCPVDGHWSSWQAWTSCSVTCAAGTKTRNRTCTHPAPAHGGSKCAGSAINTGSCNPGHCPVDGHWANWQTWSKCSVSCSDGTRTRNRTCTNPAPAYHGKTCAGSTTESGHCNNGHCPVNGQWGRWSSYGACSVTCETGVRTRHRSCNHPSPAYGGHKCPGSSTSQTSCHLSACIVNVTGTPYEFLGVGYNLLTGNPETKDPGLLSTHRIFQLTGSISNVREATYEKHSTCTPTKTTVLLHGSKAYQDELKNLIRPDESHNNHIIDAAFTYNSHFETIRNNLDNKDMVYMDRVTTCALGSLTYNTGSTSGVSGSYSVSQEFAKALCALPMDLSASSSSKYMQFLDTWGTSIVSSVDVGTKTTDRFTATPAQVYEHVQQTDTKLFEASGAFMGYNTSVVINTHDYTNSHAVTGTFGTKSTTNLGTSTKLVPVGGEVIPITDALNSKYWNSVINGFVSKGVCPSTIKGSGLQNYADSLHMALGQYANYKDSQSGYNYSNTQLLDRHNVQVPVSWPIGTYGLMQPVSGCPGGHVAWHAGYLIQDTEDSTHHNAYSPTIASVLKGRFLSTSIRTEFCMKTSTHSTTGAAYDHKWPSGTYCILKKGNCPSGFGTGYIHWDDENTNNGNRHSGTLPDGIFTADTRIFYCCRHDGSTRSPILLPPAKPFILLRYGSTCQAVTGMAMRHVYLLWDDQSTSNHDATSGVHPLDDGGTGDHKLHFCYYYPIVPKAPPLIG